MRGAAAEPVLAGTSANFGRASAPADRVVPEAASDVIATGEVETGPFATAIWLPVSDAVPADAAVDVVSTLTPTDAVDLATAEDHVVAVVAEQEVSARTTIQSVIAKTTKCTLVRAAAE
jgi:hypothetical protein